MDSQSIDRTIANEQKAMLDASSSGDPPALQKLLEDIGLQPGSDPVVRRNDTDSVPPVIHELLTKAVASKQATIVTFLLRTYSSLSLSQRFELVQAVLDNPDGDTLRALCAHDPRFASFSIDYHMQCFITEACSRPPEKIVPVLHVLLDNGADVNDGWGPGGGALYAAILGSQPLDIVEKMVRNGAIVSSRVIYAAMEKERLDVLQTLLRSGRVENGVKSEDLFEHAKNTDNEEVIAMVESFAQNGATETKPKKKSASKSRWQVWRSGG